MGTRNGSGAWATSEAEAPPLQVQVPGLRVRAGDVVVDVGCGDGLVSAYMARRGARVIGLDVDAEALRAADARMAGFPEGVWRSIRSECDPIPLGDGVADVVVATEVLEHVPDPGALLGELARVGRPGALYVLSVPDPRSEGLLRRVAPEWYWQPPFHVRVFGNEAFDDAVRDAGLEVVGRASRGFQQSLWWAFRFAIGARVGEPTPDHPLLRHWDATWTALAEVPDASGLAEVLDGLIPKSQLVLARKAGGDAAAWDDPGASPEPTAFVVPPTEEMRRRGLPRTSAWKRHLKDGRLRLGPYTLRWSVGRSA